MIAEPYICIKGQCLGEIQWYTQPWTEEWQPYADFEREKLKELSECLDEGSATSCRVHMHITAGYRITVRGNTYLSRSEIRYDTDDYYADSESNRLLKRAEFLKAVCQQEGVEWLPTEKCCEQTYSTFCDNCDSRGEYCSKECTCPCHKKPEEGFWKGNKRREGTEHLVYTMKDGEAVQTPENPRTKPCSKGCQFGEICRCGEEPDKVCVKVATWTECCCLKSGCILVASKNCPVHGKEYDKPEKPDNEGALQDVLNLGKWGTKDRTLVKHFEEEREWRKEIIGIVSAIITPTETPKSTLKYQREWLEDLRRKFT